MTEQELYAEAMAQFGFTAQMRVWNEETAELEEILNKWQEATPDETLGEIADAIIMTRQLIYFYSNTVSYGLAERNNILSKFDISRIINQVRMQISGFHRHRVMLYQLESSLRYLHSELMEYGQRFRKYASETDIQSTIDKKLHYLADMLGTRYEPAVHQ